MSSMTAMRWGLSQVPHSRKMILLVWLCLTLPALMPTLLLSGLASENMDLSLESDLLLERFSLPSMIDLFAGRSGASGQAFFFLAGLMLLTFLLLDGFLSSGMLFVFAGHYPGSFRERFWTGISRFWSASLRLLLIGGLAAALGCGTVLGAYAAITGRLLPGWRGDVSAMQWLSGLLLLAPLLFLCIQAMRYARVIAVYEGRTNMLRQYVRGWVFVLRRLPGVAAIALSCLTLTAAILSGYGLLREIFSARSWAAILAMLFLQQMIVLLRCSLHIAENAACMRFYALHLTEQQHRLAVATTPSGAAPFDTPPPLEDNGVSGK